MCAEAALLLLTEGLANGGWMCRSVAVKSAAGAPPAAARVFRPVSVRIGIILRVKLPAGRILPNRSFCAGPAGFHHRTGTICRY
jgi:hypothetical protein